MKNKEKSNKDETAGIYTEHKTYCINDCREIERKNQ